MRKLMKSEYEVRKNSQITYGRIETEQYRKEQDAKLGEFYIKYGRDSERIKELRKEGMDCRMSCIPLYLDKYESQTDKESYKAGFLENGNNLLVGHLEKFSEEQLEKYGENDFVSGIKLEEVPVKLRNNPSYAQGYLMASIMGSAKNKGR